MVNHGIRSLNISLATPDPKGLKSLSQIDDKLAFMVARAMPKIMSTTCRVARPRPYLLMLGTADDGVVNEYQLSFEDSRAFIREQLTCSDTPEVQRTLPDQGDPLVVRHKRYVCAEGVAFNDYEIEGGGHAWPGAGKPKPDKALDVNATEVILESFGLR